jgi:hypothetical protein
MVTWVFFRAHTLAKAFQILLGMVSIHTFKIANSLSDIAQLGGIDSGMTDVLFRGAFLAMAIVLAFCFKNSKVLLHGFTPTLSKAIIIGSLIAVSLVFMNNTSQFLYFDF